MGVFVVWSFIIFLLKCRIKVNLLFGVCIIFLSEMPCIIETQKFHYIEQGTKRIFLPFARRCVTFANKEIYESLNPKYEKSF